MTYGLWETDDVIACVRWLREQGCDKVYGLGESLGGSVLIQASAVKPVFRSIAACCPYADLIAIAVYRVQEVAHSPKWVSQAVIGGGMLYASLQYGIDFAGAEPVQAIARTSMLVIHGAQDNRTLPWHSEQLARANHREELWRVPGAGHVAASVTDPNGFRQRVLEWFERFRMAVTFGLRFDRA